MRLNVGLEIGWLGTNAEGIRHWTVGTFGALIRDNPQHHFTLIWPMVCPYEETMGLPLAPNVSLFRIHPQTPWRKAARRLGFVSDTARAVERLSRLDAIYWGATAESIHYPWLDQLSSVPKVVTLFDAVPLAVGDTQPGTEALLSWQRHFEHVRRLGSWWLTISKHAQGELVRLAKLDASRSIVVYPGHNFESESRATRVKLPKDLAEVLAGRPYILSVGTLEPRKNHVRLFQAFALLAARSEFAGWCLVVVGGRGWREDPILKAAQETPNAILAGRRSNAELAACYGNAAAVAYPSLYEGFGLPVAEAMAFGIPVLTSKTSSLPEVAGDAAILVDPESVESIRQGLEQVMRDSPLRERLARKGLAQAGQFNWTRAGQETLAFIEKAIANWNQ